MGNRSSVALNIDGSGDPRSVAVVINLFRDDIWPGRGFGREPRATADNLGLWAFTSGYQITGDEVSWGVYADFPELVRQALADHCDQDGNADPLPLVAFDWLQAGNGFETTDWEVRVRPNTDGGYDTHEVSTVLGERFITERTVRHLAHTHTDPAAALAALLAEFDAVPAAIGPDGPH